MISVEEAYHLIQSNLHQPKETIVSIEDAIGMVLAEDVFADRDFPPFNRVMMDGIALDSSRFVPGKAYPIKGIQFAGSEQLTLENQNACIEVMTGAMLPKGTTAVVRYEEVVIEEGMASINLEKVSHFQNIQQQGIEVIVGEVVLKKYTIIGPSHIGVLATVGKTDVKVYQPLKVAIVSTGDELVAVSQSPREFQIRQSNSHVIKAALQDFKIAASIYHINDDKATLKHKLGEILTNYDVLILSGGVSRGKKDFVPEVLDELGVNKLFHRVAQKPAKPFWFGKKDDKNVFALPGNPVSCFLGYYKYVKPWILSSYGQKSIFHSARLMQDVSFTKDLTYFLQVNTTIEAGVLQALPVQGKGSGDLTNLVKATGFLELPSNRKNFKAGEVFKLISYKGISNSVIGN